MYSITRDGIPVNIWNKIKVLLPPEKPKTGRPNKDHLIIVEGILWVLRTGVPWRDLPEKFGSWYTVYARFYRWTNQGIWQQVIDILRQQAESENKIDWSIHHIDGTVIRAHQHAAGARKINPKGKIRTQESLALGRSQGGFSTKLHLRIDGSGKPMNIILTPGQQHESTIFEPLLEEGKVKKSSRGRPRVYPDAIAGDKGYSGIIRIRLYLKNKKIKDVIPNKSNQYQNPSFDKVLYRERNRVERTVNRLKQYRRIATRYEKLIETFLAMCIIASIFMWF